MKEKHIKSLSNDSNTRRNLEKILYQQIDLENAFGITKSFLIGYKHYALESYFVNDDLEQTKQHLNHCGVFLHFLLENDFAATDWWILTDDINFPLLSDNKKLVQALMEQLHQLDDRKHVLNRIAYAMKNIYLNNKELLAEDISIIDKNKSKLHAETIQHHIDILQGFLNDDYTIVEDRVNYLGSDEFYNLYPPGEALLSQFITRPAIGYAKLAYLKGYELNIESKYIPKDWLPIQPIEEYTIPYDYVKEHCLKYNLV